MIEVAILGAGEMGGMLAHVLARRDVARTIRLIDATGQLAAGKALDIMQAAPIEAFSTRVVAATDLASAAGAEVVVIADRLKTGEWTGDEGLLLLRQLSQMARQSVVMCAGASQRDLVERGVRELGFRPEQLFGSAPEALVAAVRSMVALEVNGSVKDVALTVLGVPPGQLVVPWEDAAIAGFAATQVLDEPARRRIMAKVAPLWPPGPYALATAAAEAVAGLAGISRRTLSCFVAPSEPGGRGGPSARRLRAAALPARLSPGGVVRVELPPLSAGTQVALENAMML